MDEPRIVNYLMNFVTFRGIFSSYYHWDAFCRDQRYRVQVLHIEKITQQEYERICSLIYA